MQTSAAFANLSKCYVQIRLFWDKGNAYSSHKIDFKIHLLPLYYVKKY